LPVRTAERTARVGIAQAMAIEEQVRAYGGPRLQLTQQVLNRFAEAIQSSQVDVVPKILIAGQNGKDGCADDRQRHGSAADDDAVRSTGRRHQRARRRRATRRPMPFASASRAT
jgi:hypothetical protein